MPGSRPGMTMLRKCAAVIPAGFHRHCEPTGGRAFMRVNTRYCPMTGSAKQSKIHAKELDCFVL